MKFQALEIHNTKQTISLLYIFSTFLFRLTQLNITPSVGLFQNDEPMNKMLIADILSEHFMIKGQKDQGIKSLKGSLYVW